jgi:hypothetical protein
MLWFVETSLYLRFMALWAAVMELPSEAPGRPSTAPYGRRPATDRRSEVTTVRTILQNAFDPPQVYGPGGCGDLRRWRRVFKYARLFS